MKFETVVVQGEGITVDLLVWRRYRRPIPGMVEKVLAMNPGLAARGPILPLGEVVRLPIVEAKAETPARALVQLWD